MTDKKKRNTTELGPGECADRINALRRTMPAALADAMKEVRERYHAKEEALMARVPQELRKHVMPMLFAVQSPELPKDEPVPVIDDLDARICGAPESQQDDDEPDQTQVPAALAEPYEAKTAHPGWARDQKRLTGRSRG